uniref:Uncharacterized protein n=1 Tax=Candidatus Kentrum sp. DK TaxID=2126562 RepID=A0A450SF10_9GAMM|nr:MAG: hypothetical protein BECKDK2373B_GA0170837_10331 [Candidatus Kentron sp. DK]
MTRIPASVGILEGFLSGTNYFPTPPVIPKNVHKKNKMPLRGKRAALESGALSGGPFLMHHFEIRKLCFSDTSKYGLIECWDAKSLDEVFLE